MPEVMRAARLHKVGEPMVVEEVEVPQPGPHDVQVKVHAVNIVPNLHNVLANWTTWFPADPLPTLPSIFGLDPAGTVTSVGACVQHWKPGDRVYVNPGRRCGMCLPCRRGDVVECVSYAFSGYFGFSPTSVELLDRYQGGLCEYMIAPAYSLVAIPDELSFNSAARFGYLGTMYSALRKAGAGPGTTVLVNGISGTLGISAAVLAPAFGITTVFGTGRDKALLKDVDALDPRRLRLHSLQDGPVDEWVRGETGGRGVDVVIDALGPGAPHETFRQGLQSLARAGVFVNIGATAGDVPIDVHTLMDQQQSLLGSAWSTAAQGQEMAGLAGTGLIDLGIFEDKTYPLADINHAISGVDERHGGFTNFVVSPLAS